MGGGGGGRGGGSEAGSYLGQLKLFTRMSRRRIGGQLANPYPASSRKKFGRSNDLQCPAL